MNSTLIAGQTLCIKALRHHDVGIQSSCSYKGCDKENLRLDLHELGFARWEVLIK